MYYGYTKVILPEIILSPVLATRCPQTDSRKFNNPKV